MKIVIFGTGRFYSERKDKIPAHIEIAAFLDNNSELQGTYKDGIPIVSPDSVHEISYDRILLMSASEEAMKDQLVRLGVERGNIWYWDYFIGEMYHGSFKFYCGNYPVKGYGKKILIISTDLGYNGGTIAAVYAARALQDKGNQVVLAAPRGNEIFIKEAIESGINIVVCPSLPYLHNEELFLIQQSDVVLVNVFQMILCACEISRVKPVMWWIHESGGVYEKTLEHFEACIDYKNLDKINIYAVSNIAKKNINSYLPDKAKKLLAYGIPDRNKKGILKEKTGCLIFAIIGAVCPNKAQDIFVQAVKLLSFEEKRNVEFWIVGNTGSDIYGNQIKESASKDTLIRMTGQLTRSEMHRLYAKIDVVVCPSLEDSLPIVVTEGMMYGKVCIVSDGAGSAEYIDDGENGFICKKNDVMSLCEKMRWITKNRENLRMIGEKARDTYEKFFTMETFGERLESAIQDTIRNDS